MSDAAAQYVSRAGLKLAAALQAFKLDVRDWVCTDFGSHVGGFVDCLQIGRASCRERVYGTV